MVAKTKALTRLGWESHWDSPRESPWEPHWEQHTVIQHTFIRFIYIVMLSIIIRIWGIETFIEKLIECHIEPTQLVNLTVIISGIDDHQVLIYQYYYHTLHDQNDEYNAYKMQYMTVMTNISALNDHQCHWHWLSDWVTE